MKTVLHYLRTLLIKYPVVVAALIIYGYYLVTTLNLFQKSEMTEMGFIDFIFQYDSLIFLWIIAYIFIRSENFRQENIKNKQTMQFYLTETEKSKIASSIVSRVVRQLEDRVNNPLTVIAGYTDDIRNKVSGDNELEKKLDQIDSLLQRIHSSIKDISIYQTQIILEEIQTKIQIPDNQECSSIN
jgi:uncharacterized protein (UPF0297 family)